MATEETHYTYHVGEDIADYYTLGNELGRGAFSVVKVGTSLKDNKEYAIKIMPKPAPEDTRTQHIIEVEIGILKRVNHPNVIKMYEVFETDTEIMIVLKLITGGELFERIVELSFYSEKDAAKVLRQLLQGIKALHDSSVVHRDLKPENLLLSDKSMDADVVVTDFGLSAILGDPPLVFDAVGTPSYLAPEVLATLDTDAGYGKEVDLWGIGVILYILLSGVPPFYGDDEDEIYDRIEVGDFSFPSPYFDPISEEAKELICRFLTLDPAKRITLQEALDHPWIKGDATADVKLDKTVEELVKFNARRKFKGAVKGLIAAQKLSSGFGKLAQKPVNPKAAKRTGIKTHA